jgi:hypothetical protein
VRRQLVDSLLNRFVTTCLQTCYNLCVFTCVATTHVKTHKLQQTCSRVVAMLFQQLVNRMCSHCLFPACWQVVNELVNKLLQGCRAQQTCYKLFQQLVIVLQFNNLSTSCERQPCSNLITSLLRTHLVDKLWDFYVCTRVEVSHLVESLPTSRQQVVFALRVPSCQQVWNKLLTTCNNLVDIIRFVACKVVPTSPIQSWYNNIVTILCRQPCNILVTPWLSQTC